MTRCSQSSIAPRDVVVNRAIARGLHEAARDPTDSKARARRRREGGVARPPVSGRSLKASPSDEGHQVSAAGKPRHELGRPHR
jgi:hypothetical protein